MIAYGGSPRQGEKDFDPMDRAALLLFPAVSGMLWLYRVLCSLRETVVGLRCQYTEPSVWGSLAGPSGLGTSHKWELCVSDCVLLSQV